LDVKAEEQELAEEELGEIHFSHQKSFPYLNYTQVFNGKSPD